MTRVPSREENPNGFHGRYNITKTNREPIDERAIYFVLRIDKFGRDPAHIEACRTAALAYCDYVFEHPSTCEHLVQMVNDIRALLQK